MNKEEWMKELAQIEQELDELESKMKLKAAGERSGGIAFFRLQTEQLHNRLLLVEEGANVLTGAVVSEKGETAYEPPSIPTAGFA